MPRPPLTRQQLLDAGLCWIAAQRHPRYPSAEDIDHAGNGLSSRPILYREFGDIAGYYQALFETDPTLGEPPRIRRAIAGRRGARHGQKKKAKLFDQGQRYKTSASPCDCEWCVAYRTTRQCKCTSETSLCEACATYEGIEHVTKDKARNLVFDWLIAGNDARELAGMGTEQSRPWDRRA